MLLCSRLLLSSHQLPWVFNHSSRCSKCSKCSKCKCKCKCSSSSKCISNRLRDCNKLNNWHLPISSRPIWQNRCRPNWLPDLDPDPTDPRMQRLIIRHCSLTLPLQEQLLQPH